jgi:predicted Zn-dependent peptidase
LKTYVPTQDKQKWEITLGKLLPFNISDARFSRLLIANCVLTQHPAFAHLYQRFAQDPILAKLVSDEELDTQCKGFSGRALWSITVRGDSNASGKAVTALQNEMKSFESAGISQSEMNAAKQYLLNVIPLEGVSDSHRAADTCFDAANSGAPPDSIAREIDDIANASMESVNSFVRDEFKQSQSTLVVAGAGGRETVKAAH